MRKMPTQSRAKERVERILDATEALIIKSGVAALTVNDVAVRAKVPIGSVYQYFMNRDELLRGLCARHYSLLRDAASECFRDIHTVQDLTRDARKALEICWNYTQSNPGYGRLFFDMQAWEIVREADLEDSALNSARMARALHALFTSIPMARIEAFCLIIADSAGGTARLAARFEHMRSELFSEFIEILESHIYALMRENAAMERTDGIQNPATRAVKKKRASSRGDGPLPRARTGA